MSIFAEIGKDGTVLRVIVIEPDILAKGHWGEPANWIETKTDGSVRGKYAGIGDKFDATAARFVTPESKEIPPPNGNVTIPSISMSYA